MGMINLLNTMMNTAFDLLINTVLYIMGIAVLAGALGAMLTEFGVVALINKLLSPLFTSAQAPPQVFTMCGTLFPGQSDENFFCIREYFC